METWQASLEPGETLLWQGRPDGRRMFLWSRAIETFIGFGFLMGAGFCLVILIALFPQPTAFAVLPGILFFSVGSFFLGVWPHLSDARSRQRRRYALTDRRAVIAQGDRLGHVQVKSYPITLTSPLGGGHDRVIFATERQAWRGHTRDVDIGFERIGDEARVVYDHLLGIKARLAGKEA